MKESKGEPLCADDQLIEVARAEAILHDRDPERAMIVARAQLLHREAVAARDKRALELEAARARSARARRLRSVALGVVALGAALAAVPVVRSWVRDKEQEAAFAARLTSLARAPARLGFHEVKHWVEIPRAGVAVEVPAETCSALVAVDDAHPAAPSPLSIARQGRKTVEATSGVLFCSCFGETVTVMAPTGDASRRGLSWSSTSIRSVGGVDGLATRASDGWLLVEDALPPACQSAALQGWAQHEGHGDIDRLDPKRAGRAAGFLADGFGPVGSFATGKRFAVIRAKKDRCYVAVTEPAGVEFTLRGSDGGELAAARAGALVWCSYGADAVFSLWRDERAAPVVVVGAPANRVGGTLGASLAAERRGYRDVARASLPDELAKDARAALVAASVPASSIQEATATGLPGSAADGVVAFSLRGDLAMLPEVDPVVATACAPDRGAASVLPAQLCVQARGQLWRRVADAEHQGGAEGPRPFWLSVLEGVADDAALREEAALLLFAQRMTLLGFEPTTTEGVRDTPEGATVARFGAKAEAVAVGLSRIKPWVVPLTDGPSWTLAGAPRVVTIADGAPKAMRGAARLAPDAKDRRVVVWRR